MWPMKLDMTREECRGVLRRLELESYGNLISTFRAQGGLNKEKQRILEELRRMLHISNDRHRAEARRVANDERLTTVADIIAGPNSGQDWRREGHRSFPILPRTVPHTALTYIANTVFEQLTLANSKLPHPAETACDRLKNAEEMYKFELVRKESSLLENGFVRDAAVVTSDPLEDIMSKSYINREDKRHDVSRTEEKPTLDTGAPDDGVKMTNGDKPTACPSEPTPDQSSLCDILLNTNNRPESIDHLKPKQNKSADRSSRKKPQATKRSWKSKTSNPPAKLFKQAPTLSKNGKQSSRANNLHSPHLIHSYAVPFDVKDNSTTNGGSTPEPLQLQQHLMSNLPSQNQTTSQGTPTGGQMVKSQRFVMPDNLGASTGTTPIPVYNHQQGILPSSKKDIQYNLSKLNPTSSLGTKGNVNIPMKGFGFYSHGKSLPYPLLHYQKKSPSKNILIPTSTAAATLASLGLPTPLHPPLTDNANNWVSSKARDGNTKPAKTVRTTATVENVTERSSGPADDKRNVSEPESTPSNPAGPIIPTPTVKENPDQKVDKSSLAKPIVLSNQVIQLPVTNNVPLPAQPNLAGFTAVKSGAKLSVHKMQLVPVTGATPTAAPLTPTAQKHNVLILPKSSAVGMLNLGQKITIPKSIVDSSTIVTPTATVSPPKVIVQTVPNPYSVTPSTTFDMNIYRQNNVPSPKLRINDENAKEHSKMSPDERSSVPDAQKRSSAVTIPCDAVPGRKIKISTSQLVPFKGTLYSNTLPSANTGSVTIGAKKLKISSDACPIVRTGSSATDWENELDRANCSQVPNELPSASANETLSSMHVSVPNSNSQTDSATIANASIVHKKEDNFVTGNGNQCIDHRNETNNGKTVASNLGEDHLSATSQSEYDMVSGERGDDSSVTDSAEAEDDLDDEESQTEEFEGVEEDDFGDETLDVEMETEAIIIEEEPANYDHLIEEVPEDEQFIEEIEEDGPMEFISVGYGTTSELVAELESSTTPQQIIEGHCGVNGVEMQQESHPATEYESNSEGFAATVENGNLQTLTVSDGMVCDLLELGTDDKYHAQTYSYKQMLAEGIPGVREAVQQTHPTVRLS
ncbi:BRCA2-interacting transcriptional repressor EMSY [Anopheles maculipalpis]|uniref:BRCA2-interacting transcriptional repressor EMSY n=1 Tax=Anopheles maculipalpis TaxID=1496333 RepID=UPI002159A0B1|nr:BRCA2-interacting transcriptional repressor EMSY [Anopheles maculipalpis]